MKRIIIVFGLLLISLNSYSQKHVFVEGYCIARYEKSEIDAHIENKKRAENNENFHYSIIDFPSRILFYFTERIDSSKQLLNSKEIEKLLCFNTEYKNIEFYKFPPFNKFLSKFFDDTIVEMKSSGPYYDEYYYHDKDPDHLYQIVCIRGKSLRTTLCTSSYSEREWPFALSANWVIIPYCENKNIPAFYVYLFYDYEVNNPRKIPENFKLYVYEAN